MSIYLFENPENAASIVYDESTLTAAEMARGVAVESLPAPNTPAGKVAVLKVRKATGEVWYDYVDKPEFELEQRVVATEQALLELLLSGGGMA